MMLSKGPSRTFNGATGLPLSVMGILDVPGYSLNASCQPAPARMSSCLTEEEESAREPAHHLYSCGKEPNNTISELRWSGTSGIEERERQGLSDLILQRKWSEARQRLASEAHEHEIYESVPMSYTSQDTSRALPLHLACALRPLPPASFVRFLIKLHREAARVPEDTWGLLPMHFAVNMACNELDLSEEFDLIDWDEETTFEGTASEALERAAFNQRCIITSLVRAYPEALARKERFSGMLPLHIAATTESSHCNSPTSNAISILEMLIQKCPASVDVMDDWGETPRDIAWRNATFNCLRCRVSGRYIASDHGRCPHVALQNKGKANPLLRRHFDCHYEPHSSRFVDDMKTLM